MKKFFTAEDTDPVVLGFVLFKEFGSQYLAWEPETLWQEIELTWGTPVSQVNQNKIQAVRTCQITDSPYEQWHIFDRVCMSFHNTPPLDRMVQKPTPHQVASSMEIMTKIRSYPFSPEVYKFGAACMLDYGLSFATGVLEPCNAYVVDHVPTGTQKGVSALLGASAEEIRSSDHNIQYFKLKSVEQFSTERRNRVKSQMMQVKKD